MEESNRVLRVLDAKVDHLIHLLEEIGNDIQPRFARLEDQLRLLTRQSAAQAAYSVEEFARLVERMPYTVREWCRHGRLQAVKRWCGRGRSKEWSITHAELERFRSEGLLPEKTRADG